MATGPEHYRSGEAQLAEAKAALKSIGRGGGHAANVQASAAMVQAAAAVAHAHFAAAQAAATALAVSDVRYGLLPEWHDVVAPPEQ